MAEEKTFSESEHIAILADRVQTETAALTAERDQLAADRAELANKLDVAESAKTAAEQRATEAEKTLEDFKAEVTEREAANARKEERIAKVRESAKHLGDDFFTDEARVSRIVAMAEEEFEGYLSDLAATGAGLGESFVPRETAMAGQPAAPAGKKSAAQSFLLGRYVAQEG